MNARTEFSKLDFLQEMDKIAARAEGRPVMRDGDLLVQEHYDLAAFRVASAGLVDVGDARDLVMEQLIPVTGSLGDACKAIIYAPDHLMWNLTLEENKARAGCAPIANFRA